MLDALHSVPGVRVGLYPTTETEQVAAINEKVNVFLLCADPIPENFSFDNFDYLVEFDHIPGTERSNLLKENYRLKEHIVLKVVAKIHFDETTLSDGKF